MPATSESLHRRQTSMDKEEDSLPTELKDEDIGPSGPLLPLVIGQGKRLVDGETLWLEKWQRPSTWLDLLYDLAIAAVLSVFGNTHQITGPSAVLSYWCYFVLIWWVWASQVLYDVRFQANDWVHRLFRFLQLGAFAYMGVTAQNFDPRYVIAPADQTSPNIVAQAGGAQSFTGVADAYATGRLLLVLQYLYVTVVTRPEDRRQYWISFLVPTVTALFSAILWLISGNLTENVTAKLVLGYLGLSIEYMSAIVLWSLPKTMTIKPLDSLISDRFAALTLVILGEGMVYIVQSLAAVVAGFGLGVNGSTLNGYSECFCSLVIVCAAWHFLFHGFNSESRFKTRPTGFLWVVTHLPLHFIILLLLAGMRNVSIYGNIDEALLAIDTELSNVLDPVLEYNLSSKVIDTAFWNDGTWPLQMAKLSLSPAFPDELARLNEEINNASNAYDPYIDLAQYEAQIFVSVAQSYQIKLSNRVMTAYNELNNISTTWIADDAIRNNTYNRTGNLLDDFFTDYYTDLAQGVLYFLPCSGGLVILAMILTLSKTTEELQDSASGGETGDGEARISQEEYYSPTPGAPVPWEVREHRTILPSRAWRWISWGVHMIVGVTLALLGFLDLGSHIYPIFSTYEIPAYRLLDTSWMLPITALTFVGLIAFDFGMLVLARLAKGHGWSTTAPEYSSSHRVDGASISLPSMRTPVPFPVPRNIADEGQLILPALYTAERFTRSPAPSNNRG